MFPVVLTGGVARLTLCRHESAAQLLAVILSNHRLLEKLEMEDVQTLILEILRRLEYHVSGKRRLGVKPR